MSASTFGRRTLAVSCLSIAALLAPEARAQTVIAPRNSTVIAPARPSTPAGTAAPATPRSATPIVGTAQPAAGAAAAQSIKTERLICRGGELRFERYPGSAPIPNANSGTESLGIIFSPAADAHGQMIAAGRTGGNLKPGTCAFESRPWGGEAPAVNYQTIAENAAQARSHTGGDYPLASQRADARSIPEWLRNPANYWRFEVYDSRRGYLTALDHGMWQPEAVRSTVLTDVGTEKPVTKLGRVTNLKVTPLAGGVQFDFDGPPPCPTPTENCSKTAQTAYYFEIPNGREILTIPARPQANGRWRATTRELGFIVMNLRQNHEYQYTMRHVIEAWRGDDLDTLQVLATRQGSFRTLSKLISVRVDSLDLHAFLQELGDDFEVRIEVNPMEPGKGGAREVRGMTPARQTFRIGEEIQVRGIDRVRLLVTAITSARQTRPGCYEVRRPAERGERYFETIAGYLDACVEVGLAKIEFDLARSEFAADSVRKEFTVNGGNPGPADMKFAVHGSISVTRPQDPRL